MICISTQACDSLDLVHRQGLQTPDLAKPQTRVTAAESQRTGNASPGKRWNQASSQPAVPECDRSMHPSRLPRAE